MSSEAQANLIEAAAVINVEALLAPIADEYPAGENLQYSGLHDEIREARRADEDFEQGEWKRDLKVADFQQAMNLSIDALTNKTKDLQICAWLAEALVRQHGMVGLRDGLRLMRGLHEQFWENVYPEPDEDDLDARANAIAWMDKQTAAAIKEVQITRAETGANFSFRQAEEAKQLDIPEDTSGMNDEQLARVEALKARVAEEGKLTAEDWAKAKATTRRAHFEEVRARLDECWAEYMALDQVMDERFGRQTPGLGDLRKTLDAIRTLIGNILKEKRISEPYPNELEAPAAEAEGGGNEDGTGHASPAVSGSIRARQDAFRRLAEVADYFRKTEPHSPVAYLVQRAIRWGQMPLETWLQDVIKDGMVLGQLRETLGLRSEYEATSEE